MQRLLISALPGETRAAWLSDGDLVDLLITRDDRPSLLGGIYLGRVLKVDKSLDAAFVEIGLEQPAWLPGGECPGGRPVEGDSLIVRLVREPKDTKGARLTARITARPAGLDALAKAAKAPALLLRGGDPVARLLAMRDGPDEIRVDEEASYRRIRSLLTQARPELLDRLHFEPGLVPLFEREGVEAEVEALLQPRVGLPSGGHLLIEPVQTLTAIDVNSGRHENRGAADAKALAVNLEAAAAIPRQLRLRAISGLIVIDFLALDDAQQRKQVMNALRHGLKSDLEPTRAFPMARSGLVEMTRRRGRPPLHELLTVAVGIGGSGRVKDPVTLAYEALRAIAREALHSPSTPATLSATPAVVAALEGQAAAARADVERRLGQAIKARPRSAAANKAYEIC